MPHFKPRFAARSYMPRHPFDMILCEPAFPRVKPLDDSPLTSALMQRNTDLTPKPQEQAELQNLVNRVQAILDNIVVAPASFETCVSN